MPLDQLRSAGGEPGRIHWAFVPSAGKPDGFALLLAELHEQLQAQGIIEAWATGRT
ncbi:hypothetical protein H1235_15790 [Pseudoxanthomonas sp. NC8]|nr:hypothetical protein H1235_15790 [Pseudoxanthomonas sp. NC8]